MLSSASSVGARQCLRLHCHSSIGLVRGSAQTALSKSSRIVRRHAVPSTAVKKLHTTSRGAQAVEVSHRPQGTPLSPVEPSQGLSHLAQPAQNVVDPIQRILGPEWNNRVNALIHKTRVAEVAGSQGHLPNRLTLVGSSLSQTQQLLSAMIDEPLREISAADGNDTALIRTALAQITSSEPFTISYAPGPPQILTGSGITLDRHWLQQANLQITVLIDPALTEDIFDLIYDSEAVVFVTDDYVLSQAAHRPRSSGGRGDATHALLSRFAAKPNVHLVVNSILGSNHTQIVEGLESATGASVSDLVTPHLIAVRVTDALAANSALRYALEKQEQQTASPVLVKASTAYWDNFSSHYQRSNIGSVIELIQNLESHHGSGALVAQSAAFIFQHCLDEAIATAKHNHAALRQLRSLAASTDATNDLTLKQSLERIWPPATAYTGQLSNEEIQVWRPAAPGSLSAVDQAMLSTDALIESTFDTRLQWWKLIWKVDDVRKELESACAGFAASLEADLAYESGRLATLQVEKARAADRLVLRFRQVASQLSHGVGASKDIALATNETDGYRSSKLRTIEPSTLMEPIHRRRAQLLQEGGPIDVLAAKSRKLAITSSAAVAVTTAGVGSASVLGSSLGLVDASAASLALDPSTGVGLGLLALTLLGWRMQGQYNKFRNRFRQDWQRLSEGLDQDLKENLENVLREQIVGPEQAVSLRVKQLVREWEIKVQQHEASVKAVAREAKTPLDTPTVSPASRTSI